MTTQKQLLREALQTIKDLTHDRLFTAEWASKHGATVAKLEAALAQPAEGGEVVAWRTFDGEGGYDYRDFEGNENYASEWARLNPGHKGWVEPLYTTPPSSKPAEGGEDDGNPLSKRCYTMSESHLSGYRLIVGFESLGDAQDAHSWVANIGRPTPPASQEQAQQPKPQPMTDVPEIVERVMRYAGKTIREARNPCITARETIVLADWLASHGITNDKEPQYSRQKA